MKIFELLRPPNMQKAASLLQRLGGYQDISDQPGHTEGAFATVMYRPDKPYVVKLFLATDTPYLSYLNLIQSLRNPHFPVLRGKPMKINDKYYAVRLERLTPIETREADDIRHWASSYLFYLQSGSHVEAERVSANLPQTLTNALTQIFLQCIQNHPDVDIDMTEYNVMMRGNTVVIIDPIKN